MSNFSNFYRDLKGEPAQDIMDMSKTQKYPIGCRYHEQATGRVFRYAKVGGADLVPGNLLQSAIVAGGKTTLQTNCTVGVVVAGAYVVTVTTKTTAQPKNQFKDGFLAISDGTAMGDMYQIKSHPVQGAAGALEFTLYKSLKRALDATSKAELLGNIYKGVIQAPVTTPTGIVVGVAPTIVTTLYYGWIQTWGLCNALCDTAATAGVRLQRDVTAAGSLGKTANTVLTEVAGMTGWVVDADKTGFVFLTIAP